MCQQSVSWKRREGGGWHTMREGWLQEALDSWERWVGIGGGGEGGHVSVVTASQRADVTTAEESPTATQQNPLD